MDKFKSLDVVNLLFSYAFGSLVIERSLSQIFSTKLYKFAEASMDKIIGSDILDLKPWISLIVSIYICFKLELDLFTMVFDKQPQDCTIVLTGMFMAGGASGIVQFIKTLKSIKKQYKQEQKNG